MTDEGTKSLLVSVPEAARLLGVSRTTMYNLIDAGAVVKVKIGDRGLVTRASVEDYVDRLVAESTA